jgi:MoaA/NifB/PqqE/SkfB family radical SAM enzyme
LSGGEALLYHEIFPVMERIKAKGIGLTLISNGIILDSILLRKVFQYVDWLTLPVDTLAEENSPYHRRGAHARARAILDVVEAEGLGNVKINTVVSKLNCEEICDIYTSFISEYRSIKRWNLFEFLGRSDAALVKDLYEMSPAQKAELEERIKALPLRGNDLQIKLKGNNALLHSYVIILPNGDVIRENASGYEVIGNLVYDDYCTITSRLNINETLYTQRTQGNTIIVVK